ncbi:hypothetical protein T439DRAFT_327827 [Meredithblackwellia eburnea MCA 4105]
MSSTLPSPTLRLAQIISAVLACLTMGGVIFGFAALKPVLVAEGVYSDLCLPGERVRDETGAWKVCVDQDTRLNFMFTLASVVTNAVFLPIGYTMDNYGPRFTSVLGGILVALGNAVFGIGVRNGYFDSYIIGFILLGIGGPLIYLPSFHLSNAFPSYSGAILASVSGAFDASSIPYVFYRMAFDVTGGRLTSRVFFWGYCVFPLAFIVEQFMIAPTTTYQRVILASKALPETEPEEIPTHEEEGAASTFSRLGTSGKEGEETEDAMTGLLFKQSASNQLKSKWFFLLTFFVCIQMTRINFYLMSVDSQLERFTGNTVLAEKLTTAFTILLPVGGVVGIPFIGLLLDHRPCIDVFAVLTIVSTLMGVLGMTPAAWSQIVGIIMFVLFRPLMYTANSDSFAKIFGFQTFGTVFGLAMTFSGLCSLFNTPLDLLVKNQLKGSFIPINTILVVVGAGSCLGLVWAMWKEGKKGAIRLE